MDPALLERLQFLGGSFLLLLFFSSMAWKLGFFQIPNLQFNPPPRIALSDVLGIFALFLCVEVLLVPTIAFLWFSYKQGHWLTSTNFRLSSDEQGWFNLMAVVFSALAVVGYCFMMRSDLRQLVFWGTWKQGGLQRAYRQFYTGASTWLLGYPSIVITGQIVGIILMLWGPTKHVDQTAVRHLKSTLSSPPLFWATILGIIFLVPIAEEILFRGFLQRWLVQNLSTWKGIVCASAIFAAFHFSFSQGIDNIELLLSLFVLGCFLGYVYERQGTLWASIGLHVTFNAISVLMIVFQEATKQCA